ncbi:MAG: hypothetical protein COA74_16260 [Gammaproteobacteria bacterium]|nr:MAG: hypothetical protein COA74_16260 [Gammaproteobacteria bacterium]
MIYLLLDQFFPLTCLLCRLPSPHPLAICLTCRQLISHDDSFADRFDDTDYPIRYLSAYQSPVKELIQRGKFQDNLAVFKVLGQLLAQQIETQGFDPELVIIPVPLHNNKLLTRGYNQANEIALPLAKQLSLQINNNCVIRVQEAKTQHFLSKKQRMANAQQLFQIKATVPKKVAVVDDVFTTGATMSSITACLKNAGVELIEVWIIARTLKQS